jgi:hypothetical protein
MAISALRRNRPKTFGTGAGRPLDGNAKARIKAYARAWNGLNKQPGQHRGPITRAFMEVLEALLWGFHNSRDGRCFPSYETIAAKAECCRDTVAEAIKVLERADVLTWVHRLKRVADAAGGRIVRASNAYTFRDPAPDHAGRPGNGGLPRAAPNSENPTGTLNPESFDSSLLVRYVVLDSANPLEAALARMGRTFGFIEPGGAEA